MTHAMEKERQAAFQAFFEARDYERAIDLATQILNANLASKQERLLVAIALMRLGRRSEAREWFNEMRHDLENNPWGPLELWLWKLTLGDASLDDVLRVAANAKERCQAHYYEGARRLTEFDDDGARKAFRKCIELDADCGEVQLSRWALNFMEK